MKNRKEIEYEDDEETLISPFSREYLHGKPEQNIYCAMGLKHPIELQSLKKAFSNPIILKHPRFRSLMVRDHNGAEHWKKTHVNLDDHFIIHHSPAAFSFMEGGRKKEEEEEEEEEEEVNDFLADMALSAPLSMGKPLWEVHVLMGSNCVVLRVHHALGDGPSMMSMLWECFGKNNGAKIIYENGKKKERRRKSSGVWGLIKSLWLTLVFGMRLVGRLLGVKDEKSVIFGGDGVEFWPRKLVTTKFKLEDFKSIKKFIPNVTVNDVLLGVISSGLSKYLAIKSPDGIQLTGVVAVNLRKGPGLQEMSKLMKARAGSLSAWGNKTGGILLPIHCCKGTNPLEQVRVMKSIMDQKKHSYEAHLPYLTVHFVTSFLGPKAARWCYHKLLCSTTMGISNIMGPPDEMFIADNPVTYLKVTASSIPQSMVVHLVSYAGMAYIQVMVAKDIIHDSKFLVNCFEEALLEMKNNCSKIELFESVTSPKGVNTQD